MIPSLTSIVLPVEVRALTYHTIDHVAVYAEGDEYAVTDLALLETLLAIGFVEYIPAT
jgi:hypothetical protein